MAVVKGNFQKLSQFDRANLIWQIKDECAIGKSYLSTFLDEFAAYAVRDATRNFVIYFFPL